MSWIDILLLIVIAMSIITGFTAGFARAGVGFAAAVLGIFIAFWSYGIAAAYISDYVSSPAMANLLGFFLIFVGILALGALTGRLLALLFRWIGLSWFDRLLGAAFGAVRGVVIAAAMVTVLIAFAPSPAPRSILDSKTMPYVIDASNVLAAGTPRQIKDAFRETKEKVKKMWSCASCTYSYSTSTAH